MAKLIRAENAMSCEMKHLFKTSEGYLNAVACDLFAKFTLQILMMINDTDSNE